MENGRGRDLSEVVVAVGAAMSGRSGNAPLSTVFEQQLQRLLSVRTVRLREMPVSYHSRLVTPTRTAESVVFGVPTADPRVQAVLEASFDRGRGLDERDFEFLNTAAQLGGLVLEANRTRVFSQHSHSMASLVGSSRPMRELRERVEQVAATDFTVLVEGESGTGKELVARQIHEQGRRRNGPFVAVNCAAVVETLLEAELFGIEDRTATGVRGRRGKFEHAEGGTLFLDEVSDLALSGQAKLLRAIQDLAVERVGSTGTRRVNTRIVAATNRPLAGLVARGAFRADLFYRLGGVEIQVPPLRERREDLAELIAHFLGRCGGDRPLTLSDNAFGALRLYEWPGNVRELERMMERVVALTRGERVELHDLPPHVRGDFEAVLGPSLGDGDSMRMWASRYARLVYERCGRNKRQAARVLGISYHTLDAYLRFGSAARPVGKRVPGWARVSGSQSAREQTPPPSAP